MAGGAMRLLDDSAGGAAFQTTNFSVFIDGALAMRLGDWVAATTVPSCTDKMVTASPSVNFAGKPACRAGDQASMGGAATPCSTTTFIG
jgi:uncharacterized Zn-binding protein involved in type VI secretion